MTFVLILCIIVAIVLMLIILVQNPKGGGLASNFSQGNQIFGVEKTTDIVEKITWGGAGVIMLLSLVAAGFGGTKTTGKGGAQQQQKPKTEQKSNVPDLKTPKP